MTSDYIKLLDACVRTGDLALVQQLLEEAPESLLSVLPAIFKIDVRNTYREALSKGDVGVLIGLGNSLNWKIGDPYDGILQTEAVLNLREVIQSGEDDDLVKTVFPLLEQVLTGDTDNPVALEGDTPTIYVNGIRYRWGSPILSSPDASIKISEVFDEDNHLAILETANLAALNQKGFATLDSWKAYLRTQFNYGVTFQTSSMQHNGVVYTVYIVPEGFHSVEFATNNLSSGSEASIFQLILNIGNAVELTEWVDGKFQSVGTSTIYTDLLHTTKIVGLALATAAPTYGSRQSFNVEENSKFAVQRFMAVLASELLFKSIPEPKHSPYEFINGQERKISRPFQYILTRLMNRLPERRYPEWQLAQADIGQARKIFEVGQSAFGGTNPLYDFATYLDFRLSITRRNPRIKPDVLRDYAYEMGERVLEEIKAESTSPGLEMLTDLFSNRHVTICTREAKKSLLFVSRMLLTLADGYRKAIRQDERVKTVVSRGLVPDVLLCVFWLEAEALVRSIVLAKVADDPQALVGLLESLRSEMLTLSQEEYSETLVAPHGVSGVTAANLSGVISYGDLRYLVETLERLLNNPNYDASKSNLYSTTQLLFASLVLEGQVDLSRDSHIKTVGIAGTNTIRTYEWIQSARSIIDALTTDIVNGLDDNLIAMVGEELTRFLIISSRMRPFDRKNGTVLRYNFIQREGKVRFRSGLRFPEPFFGTSAIGMAPWERYSTLLMPCTVDIRRDRHAHTDIVTKISIGPKQLVESRYSNWKSKLRHLASKTQRGPGYQVRKALFWPTLLIFLVFLVSGSIWGWWISIPGAFFFLLERLSRWFEYWVFRK